MKKILLILLFLPVFTKAQIISTIDSVGVNEIQCMAIDHHGNLFVTTYGNEIKKIDASTHSVSVIAGTGVAGFSGDGSFAVSAKLNTPLGITVDTSGNIYFADNKNNRIRKIDITTGIITTVAGDSTYGGPGSFTGDGGLATNATLFYPQGVCFDDIGNLYIADAQNYRIRKVNTSGIINTYAGNGIQGSVGDGGPATSAKCWPSEGIIIDDFYNLYFTQNIAYPTIRKVTADGIISTIAGDTVSHVYNGDGIPATSAYMDGQYLALSKNNLLYLCDEANNNRVRYIDSFGFIHTIVGNGVDANTGDGGPATAAEIAGPSGIAFDACRNLYISDFDGNSIRKVIFDSTGIPTISISPSPNDTVCIGTSVTYTTTVTLGSAISYQWYVDGIVTGATGSAYTLTPTNADSVRCVLTGVSQCSGDTVIVSSNTIYMVVNPTPNAGNITGPDSVCSSLGGPTIITLSDTTFGGTWLSSNSHFTVSGGIVSGLGADYDTVYYVVSNACGSDSAFHTITVIGCPDNVKMVTSAASNITISPNPAATSLTIQSTNNPITQITITNLLGQTVYTQTNTANIKAQIDISQLSPGIYLIKINGTEVRKFVKE